MDNKLHIINYLGKHIDHPFTMHELSVLLKIPYATFHRVIHHMEELVNIQTIGKAKIITLNRSHASLKHYLVIGSEEEKKEYLRKNPMISKIASELHTAHTVLLFGSYAKGSEREQSDIDLLIITRKNHEKVSFSKYELLFKKSINPIVVTSSEFLAMIRDKEENVGKQSVQNHIILNNPEFFWEMVLHG